MNYKVIEDNGGGLSIYVFDGEKVIYSHSGYEKNRGQLSYDLNDLDRDHSVDGWDGCEEDPQAAWDQLQSYNYGWKIVADNKDGDRTLYPNSMGTAARLEFGITTN